MNFARNIAAARVRRGWPATCIARRSIMRAFGDSAPPGVASWLARRYRRSALRWSKHRRHFEARLRDARDTAAIFNAREPLVSVLIATYNRQQLLVERAIASVLKQSYQRFEVVVVGDCCTDDTGEAIRAIGDPRVHFTNLPARGPYPDHPLARWLVAGSAPGNHALRIARGQWLAWLDDDDEYSADHIEVLLGACLEHRWEFGYGQMDMEVRPGAWMPVGSYPPEEGRICHGSVLYAGYLRMFEFDLDCWRYGEHNDWSLWERMFKAGVTAGFVNRIVGRHYRESKPAAAPAAAESRLVVTAEP